MNMQQIHVRVTLALDVGKNPDLPLKQCVQESIELINLDLQRSGLLSSPQILTTDIDDQSIQIIEDEWQDDTE